MTSTEFVVRFYELPCPDPFAPRYIDTVFLTSEAAEFYLTEAFNELDEVKLFTREVSV